MRSCIRVVHAFLALVVIVPSDSYAQPQDAERTSIFATVMANWGSRYFAPIGFALEDDNTVMQGAVVLGATNILTSGDGVDAFWWGNEGFSGGPSEMDWGVGYTLPFRSASIRVGYEHYRYPDGKLGTPEDLVHITVNHSTVVDVTVDALWRVTDGLNKEYVVNLTVSKGFSTPVGHSSTLSVSPRLASIYNQDLWGLTGYAGTVVGTRLHWHRGRIGVFADGLQLIKSGDHLLGDREIKNLTVFQIGASLDLVLRD